MKYHFVVYHLVSITKSDGSTHHSSSVVESYCSFKCRWKQKRRI